MDSESAGNLITAGAGLLGALVGGAASIWATSLQLGREHRAELERERRAEERQRRDVAERRAREAAARCDDLVAQVSEVVQQFDRGGRPASEALQASLRDLRAATAEAAFLPPILRQRVDDAVLVLTYAPDLGQEHFDGDPAFWAAAVVARETHKVIAAWMRGEGVPPRNAEWCEYVLAAERAEGTMEKIALHHGGRDREVAQKAWRARNEEALADLMNREPQ